jgi:DNA-binding CsgD family transcriptional regulator
MERSLADAGCSVAEIVAIVRETVWNKYVDRADETRRLILEASKAIAAKPEVPEQAEEEIDREPAQRLGFLLKNVKKPKFIIQGIWTKGAVGFIAGEPKCYKSWTALDMALSIATGADFLGAFPIVEPGPVLYIQEEDPLPTLKARTGKIWVSKAVDKMELVPTDDGMKINWLPPKAEEEFDPDVNAFVQKGITISDEVWQLWLDEVIAEGMDGKPYVMIFIDTLMMVAGDVEENKSQVMTTKIFKPLKTLARKHDCAIAVVHHMGKAEKARSGQRMLGAVANHAWSEDSLYLSKAANGDIKMELESKTVPANLWRISNLDNRQWQPIVGPWTKDDATSPANDELVEQPRRRRATRMKPPSTPAALTELKKRGKALTTKDIADAIGISRSQVWRQLRRLEESHTVTRTPGPGSVDVWEIIQ